ncbi:MAG: GAF domain-containing protein, partial [Caldilineaceae bacterium]|nr:GAF domain-containing protein [Caldilineaceae bacterium]
ATLGANGRIISQVAPELELIIGEQPETRELAPAEAQNRFNLVFQTFIRVFAQRGSPLVIFLDNLQWADGLMMRLVQQLVTTPDTRHLCIIGACRPDELTAAHPVLAAADAIRQGGDAITELALAPLELDAIGQLLVDTLRCASEEAVPLARILSAKTNGNPFFLREFLRDVYSQGFVWFDQEEHRWRWRLDAILNHDIADNVVALMIERVRGLASRSQQILRSAAAIGTSFDLRMLSEIEESRPERLLSQLADAIQGGLIVPATDGEPSPRPLRATGRPLRVEAQPNGSTRYRFVHDDVRAATYSLIPDAERKSLHLRIGRQLLAATPGPDREQQIVTTVYHLNLGRALIEKPEECSQLAELNLAAGKRAKSSGAYETALQTLLIGLDLLDDNAWQNRYELTLALHAEAAEAAYLTGSLEQMESMARAVTQNARTLLDQVPVYEVEIRAYVAQNMPLKAVQTGLQLLELLDFGLPSAPTRQQTNQRLAAVETRLKAYTFDDLANLPAMTNVHALAGLRIMASIAQPTYFSFPQLYPLLTAQQVELCLDFGDAPTTATVFGNYALVQCGLLNKLDVGYRFGKLALDLLPRHPNDYAPKTIQVVASSVLHWKGHLDSALQPSLTGFQLGLDRGDLETAAICAQMYCVRLFYLGRKLDDVAQEMSRYSNILLQIGQETVRQYIEIFRQIIQNLTSKSRQPYELTGELYNITEMLPRNLVTNNRTGVFQLHFNSMILCYLFGEYSLAYEHGRQAEKDLDGARSTPFVPIYVFHYGLTLLQICGQLPSDERAAMVEKAEGLIAQMDGWAEHAPMNYAHKADLMRAEMARIQGDHTNARELYDRAIARSTQHEYLHETALAQELCGNFHTSRGLPHLGNYYLLNAHYSYQQWGASAKVSHLESRYPSLFERRRVDFLAAQSGLMSARDEAVSTIDVSSVIKASQVLSGEIVLDRLLAQLLDIVIENAGAQSGLLLLRSGDQWVAEAQKRPDQGDVAILGSQPLGAESPTPLPRTIINYVTHTQTSVVLDDATRSDAFMRDPYIVARRPRSLLCAPLMNQGKLIGMLYLENNLAPGVFTPNRLEVLNLLSSQAAISIENARLYATLEQQVEQRTAELALAIQEAERARAAAEAANESKSTFLASVSHELRTPLTSILGFASIIRRRLDDRILPHVRHVDRSTQRSIEQIQHNLDIILAEGERLTTLINNVLDLAKIEAGGFEWQLEPLSIGDVIDQAISSIMALLMQRQLTLNVELADDLPLVLADRDKLIQVVINLISNAIKFTHEGSITCCATLHGEMVMVNVVDTGIGIAPQDLATVFEKFKQVGDSLTAKPQGTGLGLSICKEIIEQLGGQIWVESELGIGSTFSFTLPAAPAQVTDKEHETTYVA